MKIKKIEHSPVDLRRILPGSWDQTYTEFSLEGIELDEAEWKKEDDLRILINDLKIKIKMGNDDGVFVYTFKRGWRTDLASVPWFVRTLVDNDDRNLIIAALVHDANFGGHFLTFGKSNELFRSMIRYSGGSWWLAFKAYWGVQNPIGMKAYEDGIKTPINNKFVKFEWKHA